MSNFHATDGEGRNFKSKKALKEAIAAGQTVYFTDTSAFSNRGTIGVAELRAGDMVVGPDPYRQRNWYANIKNGKVV
jgi:hypothetical protein